MNKEEILQKYFGHTAFREGQPEIIDAILSGRDILAVMPTGAGKSVCYQIPALMSEGITLVISPLISLMKDQVSSLIKSGIRAAYINSSLTPAQCSLALERAAMGVYKIIYVAPERLGGRDIHNLVSRIKVSIIAVDEAHCVSQWGQDFRPGYRKIADFVNQLPYRPTLCAFTATATPSVKYDILQMLGLSDPFTITTGFDRKNLYFSVEMPESKNKFLLDYITKNKNKSGMIYCSTRRSVEDVYDYLGLCDIDAAMYHAGLSADARKQNQDDFILGRKNVIVATNAFGMGIDKPDVSYVIHYNMPLNLEGYYQEAGRAGRNGAEAECILLYSPGDIFTNRFLIKHSKTSKTANLDDEAIAQLQEKDFNRLNTMINYCETSNCLRHYILEYFGENSATHCQKCSNCRENSGIFKSFVRNLKNKISHEKGSSKRTPPQKVPSELLIKLKNLRSLISLKDGVPPYLVFSDAALDEMCEKMPRSPDDLLQIKSAARQSIEKYGRRFISAINNIPPQQ